MASDETPRIPSETAQKQPSMAIETHWASDKELKTVYANNLFVSRTNTEAFLVFGELHVPVTIDPTDPTRNTESGLRLEIQPAVRIAVSLPAMAQFIQLLTRQFSDLVSEPSGGGDHA